jgi:hypothetical protein
MSAAANSFDKLWSLATYTGHYQNYIYQLEPQLRLINRENAYEQFLFNMGIGQPISPTLQFWLGQTIANFAKSNDVSEDIANSDLNEYRIWQQFLWTPRSDMLVRSRLEERHSFENAPWSVRLRERGYWTIRLNEMQSLVFSNEFFVNIKQTPWVVTSTIDQNRFFVGILQRLTPCVGLNVSYMNQYIFRVPREDNHALVLNLFINIPE